MKFLCCVLSISGPKSIKSPGITIKTDSKANKIAFIKQIAISWPSLNCMNSMATKPPIVVRELAPISGIDLLRAVMAASRMGSVWCSSLNRLQRITA